MANHSYRHVRYFRADLLPATMITSSPKPMSAHHATLSVSLCHLSTSHMPPNPNEGVGQNRTVRIFVVHS